MKVNLEKTTKVLGLIGTILGLLGKGISEVSEFRGKKNSSENSGTEITSQNSQDSDKTKV